MRARAAALQVEFPAVPRANEAISVDETVGEQAAVVWTLVGNDESLAISESDEADLFVVAEGRDDEAGSRRSAEGLGERRAGRRRREGRGRGR
jgi:hypothetical protein